MKVSQVFSLFAVILFSSIYFLTEQAIGTHIRSAFLGEKVLPTLERPVNLLTDLKFRIRGPVAPLHKIVVVEVDSASIDKYGRWPWHRDLIGSVIDHIFQAQAKAVGLDMVFSEPDQRVPEALRKTLTDHGLAREIENNETDRVLSQVIAAHKAGLVLGWATDGFCKPGLAEKAEDCPVSNPEAIASLPQGIEKFSFAGFSPSNSFRPENSYFDSAVTTISNLPAYNEVGAHAGFFNVHTDDDGVVRNTFLFMLINGKPYPSLALELATVGLNEELNLKLDEHDDVSALSFSKSGRRIAVTKNGNLSINFRGPGRTFPFVSVADLLDETSPEHASVLSKLKDAYVLVGISALGVYDMRSIPFDSNIAGVEAHASILDNLLSGDQLNPSASSNLQWVIFILMAIGGVIFAHAIQRFEAVQAISIFAVLLISGLFTDEFFFYKNTNLNTFYLYLEFFLIFVFIVTAKYISEEKNKKFLKSAFGKYVSPAVVDAILKDPDKLSLGGERREVSILFSDIRGFTTMSEGMDAKKLSGFLNDYLGIMTGLVFKFEGTLDKYIGDAVMAFWGAPLDQPNHADLAAKTALAMMTGLAENFDRFKADHGVEVRIGIGLNSGAVSVGNMGSEQNFEYTVIGDHVNLASRLEGLTKAYGAPIVTSRFTFDCIEKSGLSLPHHRVLDLVKVKGKHQAVELIQILDHEVSAEDLASFETAKVKYRAQAWDEAIDIFSKLSPSDPTSAMFLERCREFKDNPPADGWDGSWEMHEK